MKNKLLIALIGALTTGAISSSFAQGVVPATSGSYAWKLTPAVVSQYMFRGVRLGGPTFQPALELSSGPLTAGIWASVPIADKVPGVSAPEFDFYGSYTIEAIKDTLTWVPGLTIYTYPKADQSLGFYKSSVEPSIALNYTVQGLTLTPKAYYDFVLEGPTLELAAAFAVPLKDLGSELDFSGTIGTFKWTDAAENTNPAMKNVGDYWSVGVAMPFTVGAGKLTLGWSYQEGRNNFIKVGSLPRYENTAAVGRGVVSISYAISL